MNTVRTEDGPTYMVVPDGAATREEREARENTVIADALAILKTRLRKPGNKMESPTDVKNYLRLQISTLQHEEFWVLFLDTQHCVLSFDSMFRGTLGQTSVYPREVVKRALEVNAAAVILAHNHPSGSVIPSRADEYLTKTLKDALALVDVRVLDHMIVGGSHVSSFAETGLL